MADIFISYASEAAVRAGKMAEARWAGPSGGPQDHRGVALRPDHRAIAGGRKECGGVMVGAFDWLLMGQE